MYIIVVGCGRVGSDLAGRLSSAGHDVTVIDYVGASFGHLDPAYRGRTIEADPLTDGTLERADIRHADGLAAVTNSDAVNAVVAHAARRIFGVPNVVARNYDPRWLSLHEALGIQTVSTTVWGSQRIQEVLESPGLRAVFAAGQGEIEIYELVVPVPWEGRPLGALVEGIDCAAVSVTRGGRAGLARPDGLLEAGDIVHVAAAHRSAEALRRRLVGEEGPACSC